MFTCVGLKWINVNTRLGHACHTRVTRVFLACDTRVTRVEDVKVHGDSTVCKQNDRLTYKYVVYSSAANNKIQHFVTSRHDNEVALLLAYI